MQAPEPKRQRTDHYDKGLSFNSTSSRHPFPASSDHVEADGTRAFSCFTCRSRKVKCDKLVPTCTNCSRSSQECSYVAPIRGKRKPAALYANGNASKISRKETLHEKLERYEALLKQQGVDVDQLASSSAEKSEELKGHRLPAGRDDDRQSSNVISEASGRVGADRSLPTVKPMDQPSPFEETKAQIVQKDGSTRYFDNNLWPGIGQEADNPEEQKVITAIRDGMATGYLTASGPPQNQTRLAAESNVELDENSLILGSGSPDGGSDMSFLHPSLEVVKKLWPVFLERVDPLVKLVHTPSLWDTVLHAQEDPKTMSTPEQALLFAVYPCMFTALFDDECEQLMGAPKKDIIKKYRAAARQALFNAKFISSSSLLTLQAYLLFLLGMRGVFQGDSFYIMSGIAVRLARRMGLHRDGSTLGLSPFEAELRRRLWWQLIQIDTRASDFSGTNPSMDLVLFDTNPPQNILDEDMSPSMKQLPPETVGITPSVFLMIRCAIVDALRNFSPHNYRQENHHHWDRLTSAKHSIPEKDAFVDEMEDRLERKFIRHCDPAQDLHFFVQVLARGAVCKLRLLAHNPRQFAELKIKMPQRSRDVIWRNGMKLLEYGMIMHSKVEMRKYTWQIGTSYLWDTLLYILIEMRHRKTGTEVDRAWKLVENVFANYPQVFVEEADTLYVALGNWTLQVWEDCRKESRKLGLERLSEEPEFILNIRKSRKAKVEIQGSSKVTGSSYDIDAIEGASGVERDVHTNSSTSTTQQAVIEFDGSCIDDLTDDFSPFGDYDFSNLLSYDLDAGDWSQFDKLLGSQGM